MEYINPENDKYKIINLLFSCDQINFDLGYILSKNVKEIEVDDIDIYFERELNKKNYTLIHHYMACIMQNSYLHQEFYKNMEKAKKYLLKNNRKSTFPLATP